MGAFYYRWLGEFADAIEKEEALPLISPDLLPAGEQAAAISVLKQLRGEQLQEFNDAMGNDYAQHCWTTFTPSVRSKLDGQDKIEWMLPLYYARATEFLARGEVLLPAAAESRQSPSSGHRMAIEPRRLEPCFMQPDAQQLFSHIGASFGSPLARHHAGVPAVPAGVDISLSSPVQPALAHRGASAVPGALAKAASACVVPVGANPSPFAAAAKRRRQGSSPLRPWKMSMSNFLWCLSRICT